jgi:hypothetical protein
MSHFGFRSFENYNLSIKVEDEIIYIQAPTRVVFQKKEIADVLCEKSTVWGQI